MAVLNPSTYSKTFAWHLVDVTGAPPRLTLVTSQAVPTEQPTYSICMTCSNECLWLGLRGMYICDGQKGGSDGYRGRRPKRIDIGLGDLGRRDWLHWRKSGEAALLIVWCTPSTLINGRTRRRICRCNLVDLGWTGSAHNVLIRSNDRGVEGARHPRQREAVRKVGDGASCLCSRQHAYKTIQRC